MEIKDWIAQYLKAYRPYKTYWNYEDGCILNGCSKLYEVTGENVYLEFITKYLNQVIDSEGKILSFDGTSYNLDSFNSGKVLMFMYHQTGEKKYRQAIEFLMERLRSHPRTEEGSFWHKSIYPGQVWLDGLYMVMPFYMQYETEFDGKKRYDDILRQYRVVRKHMFNENAQLYYHGYDSNRKQFWCDPATGCSHNFWLRSVGWYLMSLVDVMDSMSMEIFEQYREYQELLREAVKGILRYQDPQTGLFYQVIDQAGENGNYLETSGSAMIAYAIMKACHDGILLEEKYERQARACFQGIVTEKWKERDQGLQLIDICKVAGLGNGDRDGSVGYYLSEPKTTNDPKGVGPFMMAYAQDIME